MRVEKKMKRNWMFKAAKIVLLTVVFVSVATGVQKYIKVKKRH